MQKTISDKTTQLPRGKLGKTYASCFCAANAHKLHFFNEGAKPYVDLSFGFRFASDRDFAFSIQACGSFYAPFNETESYWDSVTDKYITTSERRNLSSVGLRLGIEW